MCRDLGKIPMWIDTTMLYSINIGKIAESVVQVAKLSFHGMYLGIYVTKRNVI